MVTEEAIDLIERLLIAHRQTHVNWLNFYVRCPEQGEVFVSGAGSLQDQKDAIADYDEALEALKVLREKSDE